jgi:hypothetical protein
VARLGVFFKTLIALILKKIITFFLTFLTFLDKSKVARLGVFFKTLIALILKKIISFSCFGL